MVRLLITNDAATARAAEDAGIDRMLEDTNDFLHFTNEGAVRVGAIVLVTIEMHLPPWRNRSAHE